MMGSRLVPVCAALAVAVVPGCGRTGLDDPIGLGPGNLGGSADDAGDDALPSSSGGGGNSSGGESSSGGGVATPGSGPVPTTPSDAGDPFGLHVLDAGAAGPAPAIDAQGPGKPVCGPGDCAGCCADDGTCESGQATSSCGHDGQPCRECEAERSCNERGVCL
jgi:hypothetical protein